VKLEKLAEKSFLISNEWKRLLLLRLGGTKIAKCFLYGTSAEIFKVEGLDYLDVFRRCERVDIGVVLVYVTVTNFVRPYVGRETASESLIFFCTTIDLDLNAIALLEV
jgi:hypothetical protein